MVLIYPIWYIFIVFLVLTDINVIPQGKDTLKPYHHHLILFQIKKNEEKERKKMVKRKPYKHILTTEKTFISIKAISLTF